MFKIIGAVLLLTVLSMAAFGQTSLPASKAAVQVADFTLIPYGPGVVQGDTPYASQWKSVLSAKIKTSQQKDLFVGASLVTGLYTDTLVSSKNGVEDTSTSTAGIEVQVVIDRGTAAERTADPGTVDYDKRKQQMTAKFGGIIQSCTDANGDGTITFPTECVIDPEELQLVLETLGAHHFNFVIPDLGAGVHTVDVMARVNLEATAMLGKSKANALVGKGSLTVEEVRLVKGAEILAVDTQ